MFRRRTFKLLAGGVVAAIALAIASPASAVGYWDDTVSYNGCTGAEIWLYAHPTYASAYTWDAGACTTKEEARACARTQGGVPSCTGYIQSASGSVNAYQPLANNYAGTSNHRIEVGSGNWSGYWNSDFTLV